MIMDVDPVSMGLTRTDRFGWESNGLDRHVSGDCFADWHKGQNWFYFQVVQGSA